MTLPEGWRRYLLLLLVALALGGGGYAFGRFGAPDKVRTQEHETVKTVEHEDLVSKARVHELELQLESMKRDTHREVVTVYLPSGVPASRKETVDTHVEQHQEQHAEKTETEVVHDVKTVEVVKTVTVSKLVERERPSWRVGALVGVDVRSGKLSYGPALERRVLGPISVGLWAQTSTTLTPLQVGAMLSVEF